LSILLICNHKDPKPWAKALSEKLPTATIEIFPEVADPDQVDYIICWKPKANTFQQFPKLKVVQSLGAGVEHITETDELPASVRLTRIVDPQLAIDMWEFVLAIVMNKLKLLPTYQQQQVQKEWEPHTYRRIPATSIGLLGLGKIGALVAQNFAQLGFQVVGWSNSKKEIAGVQTYIGADGFSSCLSQTDILINILPLTPNTEGILNQKNLCLLKKGAYLINVGRGGHLVEEDLIPLLNAGQLSGAFLDVFRTEPLPSEHPFWTHPQVSVTPHIASLTHVETAVAQLVENYQRFKAGKALRHEVSLEKGY